MESKTIVFDLRALQIGHQHRGIGVVIRSAIENLNDTKNNYIFYMFDGSNPIDDLGIHTKNIKYTIVTTPKLNNTIKQLSDVWDLFKLSLHRFTPLRKHRIDSFVQFDFSLGLPRFRKVRTIVMAYDLIPLIMKREYLPSPFFAISQTVGIKSKIKAMLRSSYYILKSKKEYQVYKRSKSIIAISDVVKDSFADILRINRSKISVINLAPDAKATDASDRVLDSFGINKPYILYIGGTDSRKRIEEIVYAFNITQGRGSNLELVLAGNEFKSLETLPNITARNAIVESPYRDKIHFAGYVDDSEKNGLYQNAHAFIFCSTYEGFGLPVLEAYNNSCPVVCYDNSSVSSLGHNSAIVIETGNYVRVAEAIGRLFDESVRSDLISSGKKKSSRYTWEKFSSKLLGHY
jgi:glycosyltransferase involved in cell wall biosynthesis